MSDFWEEISICSGIGGITLGLERAKLAKPILFCEIEPFCQKVLNKHWPSVPICTNVKELAHDPEKFIPRAKKGTKRILTGGYPCQSFSQAGKRLGWEDERAIYPFISQIIEQERPFFILLENVRGHISLGLDDVLNDLGSKAYATTTLLLPSGASVGSPHKRERIFILGKNMADTNSIFRDVNEINKKHGEIATQEIFRNRNGLPNTQRDVPNTNSQRGCSGQTGNKDAEDAGQSSRDKKQGGRNIKLQMGKLDDGVRSRLLGSLEPFPEEPKDIPRVATEQKDRAKKLKALGNSVVPNVIHRIGLAIKESFNEM